MKEENKAEKIIDYVSEVYQEKCITSRYCEVITVIVSFSIRGFQIDDDRGKSEVRRELITQWLSKSQDSLIILDQKLEEVSARLPFDSSHLKGV